VSKAELLAGLADIGERLAVTVGRLELPPCCGPLDFDWNQMDMDHRLHVHHTYRDAVRLVLTPDMVLSIIRMPALGVKLLLLTTDIRLGPGQFLQSYSLFNLLAVQVFTTYGPELVEVEWFILSPRFLRIVHPFIHRRLDRINRAQYPEDLDVRRRRQELRDQGYTFDSDRPDYVTSNRTANRVHPPPLDRAYRLPLPEGQPGSISRIVAGPIEILLRHEVAGGYTCWPATCPHEGGPLACGRTDGSVIRCPWHGLAFGGVPLDRTRGGAIVGSVQLEIGEGHLTVCQAPATGAPA
jgi:nitrite reductase/ring-hydroxylating ferredoxin subunit